jgi:hypothetical protein
MSIEESGYEFRKYYPAPNPQKAKKAFDFFISDDESIIYKRNNNSNKKFSEIIKKQENFKDFENVLNGTFFSPSISNHICKGYDLESDGSHKMKFLHGYRLDLIASYELDPPSTNLIINQIEILLICLAKANEDGDLFGDWATHNLVFSFEYGLVFNIDLEGFMTYRPLPEWADYNTVEGWLKNIIRRLQSSSSTIE